jgi:hypothetical protein
MMSVWRGWASVALVVAAAGPVAAQKYTLTETPKSGQCAQYQLEMKLSGTNHTLDKDNQPVSMPLEATARHVFAERILEVEKRLPQKAVRAYEAATASLQAGGSRSQRTLRADRTLLVVQRTKDQTVIYCPKGPMTPEEIELTGDFFDTLSLTGLLPGKEVALQETWKVPTDVAQALCHFEGLKDQDLTCKLDEVKDNIASVSVTGSANGIDLGAPVKVSIQAAYRYDLAQQRLVYLEWKQKDDRGQGPASPASVIEAAYVVKRAAIDPPESLSDVVLVSVPQGDIPDEMLQLAYRHPKQRFDLNYERDWHIVGQTDQHTVLRLMDRGDFVAQVTITPWTKARPGEHLSAEEFQRAMAQGPWKQEEMLQAGEVAGRRAIRSCWRSPRRRTRRRSSARATSR